MKTKLYDLTIHPVGVSTAEFIRLRDGLSGEFRVPDFRAYQPGEFLAIFDLRNSGDIILKRIRGVIPCIEREDMVELHFKQAKSAVIRCGGRGVYALMEAAG